MTLSSEIKKVFNIESNPVLFNIINDILKSDLSALNSYQQWRKYFCRYIDPTILQKGKGFQRLEQKFDADFFTVLFSAHLVIYLLGKQMIKNIKINFDVNEAIYEEAVNCLPRQLKKSLLSKLEEQLNSIDLMKEDDAYSLFENMYKALLPRHFRKPLGEYFTDPALAARMVNETKENLSKGLWMDNSSGFGVFLIAYLKKFGVEKIINFVSIEANPLSVFIAKILLILEFKHQLANINSLPIFWGDSLLNEQYEYKKTGIQKVSDFSDYFDTMDVIIGNPPWVSWKSITKEYRDLIAEDWRSYDIFEKNITRRTLGACNDNVSGYFVYYSIDKFLRSGGLLKLIINLSLFKSHLAGRRFRQFNIKKRDTPFKITKICDLTECNFFQEIKNSYCTFEAIKGKKTTYPIQYLVIKPMEKNNFKIDEKIARPVKNKEGGSLITVKGKDLNNVEGKCEYKARAGVCTWLNGVYWVDVIAAKSSELMTITNLSEAGKKKLRKVNAQMEKKLIYKLLRARNLTNIKIDNYIIIPQAQDNLAKPIAKEIMQRKHAYAFHYFSLFEKELLERSGYKKFLLDQPFYGLYNIGPYSIAPIKLAWQFIARDFRVSLINNAEYIIPDLNVMFIPLSNIDEAYYLYALLNSKYVKEEIEASSNWTFPSGSIQKIHLEKFNQRNPLHSKISLLQKSQLIGKNEIRNKELNKCFKQYWFS